MYIYDQDPNQALVIIDSALLIGNIDDDLATMLKAKVYSQSNVEQHLDTARQMLEGLLESELYQSVEYHEVVLDLLVSITRQQDNYEQCLRWATEKADDSDGVRHEFGDPNPKTSKKWRNINYLVMRIS